MTDSPIVVDGDLSDEKISELLERRAEYPELDYKRRIDLSEKRDEVELSKDVAAMVVRGGYLLIGVGTMAPSQEAWTTRFTGRCAAHPNAAAKVAGPLKVKRSVRPNSPPQYAVGTYAPALVEGATYRVHLSIVFSSQYPNQVFGGTLGLKGCTAIISGAHHK